MAIQTKERLRTVVLKTVQIAPVTNIHTHLYSDAFGKSFWTFLEQEESGLNFEAIGS